MYNKQCNSHTYEHDGLWRGYVMVMTVLCTGVSGEKKANVYEHKQNQYVKNSKNAPETLQKVAAAVLPRSSPKTAITSREWYKLENCVCVPGREVWGLGPVEEGAKRKGGEEYTKGQRWRNPEK